MLLYTQRSSAVFLAALFLLGLPFQAGAQTASSIVNVETRVRTYFADLPVMIAVAKCESEFRQFNRNGDVLHGGYKKTMTGIFQIARIHLLEATTLGLDINTLEGNMAFARHLYEMEGTTPWDASYACWGDWEVETARFDAKILALQQQINALRQVLALLQ